MGIFDWFIERWFIERMPKSRPTPTVVPTPAQLIEAWRRIDILEKKSWVLFSHGTCVIVTEPQLDIRAQAVELMRKHGPVHAGSPAGDFSVVTLTGYPGWIVTCYHTQIATYVTPDELSANMMGDMAIGTFGRDKRHRDAFDLEVIHIEDKRNAA